MNLGDLHYEMSVEKYQRSAVVDKIKHGLCRLDIPGQLQLVPFLRIPRQSRRNNTLPAASTPLHSENKVDRVFYFHELDHLVILEKDVNYFKVCWSIGLSGIDQGGVSRARAAMQIFLA